MTSITLPWPPSLNRLYRTVHGRPILSKEGRDYKKIVRSIVQYVVLKPMDGALRVKATFYRPAKRGDLDNMLKATLDALNGIIWQDDKQIEEINAFRRDDRSNPRVEMIVEAV